MKKSRSKILSCLILIITLLFIFPSVIQKKDAETPFGVSAFLSADDPELTKEKIQQEMYDEYKRIFDFVSSSTIIADNQAIPFEDGEQSSNNEIDTLSAELTAECTTDYEKAVSIYNWIIENIYYDYDYNNGITNFTYTSAVDVFNNKHTVCEGYANLYSAMCRSVGVPCRKVIGYAVKDDITDDDLFYGYFENRPNHAWNEVYLNNEWIVTDATWDCANKYENGKFTSAKRVTKWYGTDFEEFSKYHLAISYDDVFKSDKFTFTVSNNKIIASNYVGSARKVIVPKGVDVITKLSESKSDFTSVVLPATLKEISDEAFKNCTGIVSVTVPDGVTLIGNEAFSGCTSLATVKLPATIKTLGKKCFYNCTALKNIDLPEGIEIISPLAFCGCISIEAIDIPSSVSNIGSSAFKGCSSIGDITIPETVTVLESSVFQDCTGLKSAVLNCKISVINSSSFSRCTSLTTVHISDTVTEIANDAFRECTSLKTITGAENVTILRFRAFFGCTLLENCNFFDKLTHLEYQVFKDCQSITSIRIPFTNASIGEYDFSNCISLGRVVIEGKVTAINTAAFYNCTSLKEVVMPDSVTTIGEFAFAKCTSLETVDLPDGLTVISDSAFSGCVMLKSIGGDIPLGVISIGEYAFYDCDLRGEFTIPDAVTVISKSAFYQCSGITRLNIPVGVKTICEFAFTRLDLLTDVYYNGTKAQWDNIVIEDNNSALLAAKLHCIDDHQHSFDSFTTVSPTCTSAGLLTFTCTCGFSFTEEISAVGHNNVDIPAVDATCTETGLTGGVKCSVCGEIIIAQTVTPSLGHSESGWIIDSAATCSAVGSKHTECKVCGKTIKTDVISKLRHTETAIPAVDATCTETGLTGGVKCSVCGEIIIAQTVTPSLGHSESGWIIDSAATCSAVGSKHTECTVCGKTIKTDVISKLSHTETAIPAVDATCTETGLTGGVKCSVCGEVIITQTVTSVLDHSESGWIIDSAATCSAVGSKHTECTVCSKTIKTDVISKLSHTETAIPAVDATCTETGLTGGVKCSVCGEIIIAQTVTPSLGHSESGWITNIPATCTKEGVQYTKCTVCGVVIRNTKISKLSHKDSNNDNVCDVCSVAVSYSVNCSHICHQDGFAGVVWSVIRFFSKLFGINKVCDCGTAHYG